MEVRKVMEEWEIWDEKEEVAKSEVEAKKLVPEEFHRWIKVFEKKQSVKIVDDGLNFYFRFLFYFLFSFSFLFFFYF